jgi:hypothetical protein
MELILGKAERLEMRLFGRVCDLDQVATEKTWVASFACF